ncbi:MAG: ribosomal protein L7/L12 [Bacteroidales bacterium]|nr:ribosomal protein L7/L12 [Bacteroidales bacterium]
MSLYLIEIGHDRFATLAEVRRIYGMSIGEASSLLSVLPVRLPDADGIDEDTVEATLVSLGAKVSHDAGHDASAVDIVSVDEPAPADRPVKLRLTDAGCSKLAVVKAVRDAMGLLLADAKQIVDSAPVDIVLENRERADQLFKQLNEAGATVFCDDEEASSGDGGEAVVSITVTDAGHNGMKLVRLLKERLGMKYADAASIAEHGGRLPVTYDKTSQGQLDADRMINDLTALGVAFTTD